MRSDEFRERWAAQDVGQYQAGTRSSATHAGLVEDGSDCCVAPREPARSQRSGSRPLCGSGLHTVRRERARPVEATSVATHPEITLRGAQKQQQTQGI
jgi:hypothetical protein